MTEDDLIGDIFAREGDRYGDATTQPPIDQPTGRGGITLKTLTDYLGHPAEIGDLKALTHDQAVQVVRWKLRQIAQQNHLDLIPFEPLRLQLIDFAYNSGPGLAIRWLQRCLRVPRTSQIDAATTAAVQAQEGWLVNQALVAARLQMIERATDGGSIDRRFEEGLEHRAHRFSLLEIP